jgi:hypothetical protein
MCFKKLLDLLAKNIKQEIEVVDIFKRIRSINKLQKAMGHSSINVSLTYLRGLEVPEHKEEDILTI